MTIAFLAALVVLVGSFTTLWWADRQDARIEADRARWRQRRLQAHAGRCPWSGKQGVTLEDIEWVVACPRCAQVFPSWADDDLTLPAHDDDRTR